MSACGIACGAAVPPETALRELRERYQMEVVALTLGAEGALIVTATETVRLPLVLTADNYALAILVVACASALSAWFAARKLADINLVSALKALD